MHTTFYFNDGTIWEWKDQPLTAEDVDIMEKYFPCGLNYHNMSIKHPDISKVVMSLEPIVD